jgi:hypothetical protein
MLIQTLTCRAELHALHPNDEGELRDDVQNLPWQGWYGLVRHGLDGLPASLKKRYIAFIATP